MIHNYNVQLMKWSPQSSHKKLHKNHAKNQIIRYEKLLRSGRGLCLPKIDDGRKQAAVFVLFLEEYEKLRLLFIRRSLNANKHSGEWAFPGGAREAEDQNFLETAYRETHEELGILKPEIQYWGPLEPVVTLGSGYTVWPFTGLLRRKPKLIPSPLEVSEVSFIPIDVFNQKEKYRDITIQRGKDLQSTVAFTHKGKVIWGATARILNQIFNVDNPFVRWSKEV